MRDDALLNPDRSPPAMIGTPLSWSLFSPAGNEDTGGISHGSRAGRSASFHIDRRSSTSPSAGGRRTSTPGGGVAGAAATPLPLAEPTRPEPCSPVGSGPGVPSIDPASR